MSERQTPCSLCGQLGLHWCSVQQEVLKNDGKRKEIWEYTFKAVIASLSVEAAAERADAAVAEWEKRFALQGIK